LRKLDNLIHRNESHIIKMQRDLVVVTLYDSIYNQYKIVKCKIANIINYQYWEQYTVYSYNRIE